MSTNSYHVDMTICPVDSSVCLLHRHMCVFTRLAVVDRCVHVNMTLVVCRPFLACTQKHVLSTGSTSCLHDVVSCQRGYVGLLTCLNLVARTVHFVFAHLYCTQHRLYTRGLHTTPPAVTSHNSPARSW